MGAVAWVQVIDQSQRIEDALLIRQMGGAKALQRVPQVEVAAAHALR